MGSARLLYAYGPEGVFIRNIGRDLQVETPHRDVRLSGPRGSRPVHARRDSPTAASTSPTTVGNNTLQTAWFRG